MERKKFSYDEYSDSLIVSNKDENGTVKENFEVGDIIFSLNDKGKIMGIEVRGISNFLESCEVNPDILKNIKGAELKIVSKRGTIFLILKMEVSDGVSIIYHDIPLVLPLVSREENFYKHELAFV